MYFGTHPDGSKSKECPLRSSITLGSGAVAGTFCACKEFSIKKFRSEHFVMQGVDLFCLISSGEARYLISLHQHGTDFDSTKNMNSFKNGSHYIESPTFMKYTLVNAS